jgi:hypothetical protein
MTKITFEYEYLEKMEDVRKQVQQCEKNNYEMY